MIEHDCEKIGITVSKSSANFTGSACSAEDLAENPKQLAESGLGFQDFRFLDVLLYFWIFSGIVLED